MFRHKDPKPQEPEYQDVDPVTGEVLSASKAWYHNTDLALRDAKKVSDMTSVRPSFINLKDHQEMSGKTIAIRRVTFRPSTVGAGGEYAHIGCFVLDEAGNPTQPMVIMTSAEDVLARCYQFEEYVNAGNTVIGTLRSVGKAGQAWILE